MGGPRSGITQANRWSEATAHEIRFVKAIRKPQTVRNYIESMTNRQLWDGINRHVVLDEAQHHLKQLEQGL